MRILVHVRLPRWDTLGRRAAVLALAMGWLLPRALAAPPRYEARRVAPGAVVVDGKIREVAWQQAELLTQFTFPWQQREAPLTEFRAVVAGDTLCFVFHAYDTDQVVQEKGDEETVVMGEDRVELFFASDRSLKHYYCLEIDPLGRVLDYAASHYRKFDNVFDCPSLIVVGRPYDNGYIVEGKLDLLVLERLVGVKLLAGEPIWIGLFRADFTSQAGKKPKEAWISWVRPAVSVPDFHVPSAFGTLQVVD